MPFEEIDSKIKAINRQLKVEIATRDDNLKAVASRAGLSYGVVRRYVAGEREMPIKVFLELCAAIGVNADDVLTRAEELYAALDASPDDVLTHPEGQ